MPGFAFLRRTDRDATLRLVRERRGNKRKRQFVGVGDSERVGPIYPQHITEGFLYLTPSEGIPARVGINCGSAECIPYYVNPDGEYLELKDNGDAQQTNLVHNTETRPVPGDAHIKVRRVYEELIADVPDNCNRVQFELLEAGGGGDISSISSMGGGWSAMVTEVPCGCGSVPDEEDGRITVFDTMGCLDLEAGLRGWAEYVEEFDTDESGSGASGPSMDCYWSIFSLCCP